MARSGPLVLKFVGRWQARDCIRLLASLYCVSISRHCTHFPGVLYLRSAYKQKVQTLNEKECACCNVSRESHRAVCNVITIDLLITSETIKAQLAIVSKANGCTYIFLAYEHGTIFSIPVTLAAIPQRQSGARAFSPLSLSCLCCPLVRLRRSPAEELGFSCPAHRLSANNCTGSYRENEQGTLANHCGVTSCPTCYTMARDGNAAARAPQGIP